MRGTSSIHVVLPGAEGAVGDEIAGGVAPPPGATLWVRHEPRWKGHSLRCLLPNQPRCGVVRHVRLPLPPNDPPQEAPGGLVAVRAECRDGKAGRSRLRNPPCLADRVGVWREVAGLGRPVEDTGCERDSFVVVDAAALGLRLVPDEACRNAKPGGQITTVAKAQQDFRRPGRPEWRHSSFCLIAGPLTRRVAGWVITHAVSIRSPARWSDCPPASPAPPASRCSRPGARSDRQSGCRRRQSGTRQFGEQFGEQTVGAARIGDRPAIQTEISGSASMTGLHRHLLAPADFRPEGHRLSDIWGAG